MNLIIHLPPELEARLCEQAKALGKVPEDIAIEALQEKLFLPEEPSAMLPRIVWKKEFEAFPATVSDGNPDADVSRESIYEGRGE